MGDVMDSTVLHINYKGKAYGRQEKAPTRLIFDPNRLLVYKPDTTFTLFSVRVRVNTVS